MQIILQIFAFNLQIVFFMWHLAPICEQECHQNSEPCESRERGERCR